MKPSLVKIQIAGEVGSFLLALGTFLPMVRIMQLQINYISGDGIFFVGISLISFLLISKGYWILPFLLGAFSFVWLIGRYVDMSYMLSQVPSAYSHAIAQFEYGFFVMVCGSIVITASSIFGFFYKGENNG